MTRWALLLCPLLAACGRPEGQLTVRLLKTAFEDPYQQVSELLARVLDTDLEPQFDLDPASGGGRLELGIIAAGAQRLEIQGRGGGLVHARGVTRVLSPGPDRTLEELLPFSRRGAAAIAPSTSLGSGAAIDGALGEWQLSPALLLGSEARVSGPAPTGARDVRAELYLAWTTSELRFALQVTDDCIAIGGGSCSTGQPDRIELGVDGNGDASASYGTDDTWVEIEPSRVVVVKGSVTAADLPVKVSLLPDGSGWAVEGALRLGALGRGPLQVGQKMGLDLVIVDEDAGQSEPTRLSWSGWSGSPTPPARMGRVGPGSSGP